MNLVDFEADQCILRADTIFIFDISLMRFILNLLLFAIILVTSCTTRESGSKNNVNFDWLLGKWQRTNEAEGKITYEYWEKVNELKFEGTSFTLQNADTIWHENVVLQQTGPDWYYEVTPKGEVQNTTFKLTTISAKSFTCENEANEFPKKILYTQQSDSTFHAVISGGDVSVDFDFKKLTQ